MNKPTMTVGDSGNLTIHIPMLLRKMNGRKMIIVNALDGSIPDAVEPVQGAVVQALARAFAWVDMIENGQFACIGDLAERIDVDAAYVRRIIKLTTLAPAIVMALLNGEEPDGLSLARLVKAFPVDWREQRRAFGFLG